MEKIAPLTASSAHFSVAFQQVCNLVAIEAEGDPRETLRQLVLQCFVLSPTTLFNDVGDIRKAIDSRYGLKLPKHQLEEAIDYLESKGSLARIAGSNLVIAPDVREAIQRRIEAARQLEDSVRETWAVQLKSRFPSVSPHDGWAALQEYLKRAYRQHGVQTVALLDPTVDTGDIAIGHLASLLDEVVDEAFDEAVQAQARAALTEFLAGVGEDGERARYITQLADGTYSFFSLSVDPDVAARLRADLRPLTLFLDTNFLFGILDLHVHPQVDVSNELVRAVPKHNLPFLLCYHPKTLREIESSVQYYGDSLRRHPWTRSLSRAACASYCLSGVELRYHQANAETGIDVESFLKPFNHIDVLLEQRGIQASESLADDDLPRRSDLIHDYGQYLISRHRHKPYESIDHDATVLLAARALRSSSPDSLSAGALLMTCDHVLFRFDWETSRREKRLPCTVLPNLFWQILRPFLPPDTDFERSFAQTFAIPEFRAIGDGGARACSKMLSLLTAYKDLPEETARRLVTNDLLIDKLRTLKSDEDFEREIESAIAAENINLAEERRALSEALEEERAAKKREVAKLEAAAADAQKRAAEAERQRDLEVSARQKTETESAKLTRQLQKLSGAVEPARAPDEKAPPDQSQNAKRISRLSTSVAVLGGLLAVLVFELVMYLVPVSWVVNHPNAYSLQALADFIIVLGIWQLVRPPFWREWMWAAAGLPALVLLLGLLGGR